MGLRRIRVSKELELISLIDVIFLLIIFGLTVSLFTVEQRDPVAPKPQAALKIEVSYVPNDTDPGRSHYRATIISNLSDGTDVGVDFPAERSLEAEIRAAGDFDRLSASRTITERVQMFAESLIAPEGNVESPGRVYVVVDRSVRLRLLNFVLNQFVDYRQVLQRVELQQM